MWAFISVSYELYERIDKHIELKRQEYLGVGYAMTSLEFASAAL